MPRELPPRVAPEDRDYAIGRLAAEVSALSATDERFGGRLEVISQRMDDLERRSHSQTGATKVVGWILGGLLASLLSLGTWLVRTALVDEERINNLESDLHEIREIQKTTSSTLSQIREDLREVRTIQAQQVQRETVIPVSVLPGPDKRHR